MISWLLQLPFNVSPSKNVSSNLIYGLIGVMGLVMFRSFTSTEQLQSMQNEIPTDEPIEPYINNIALNYELTHENNNKLYRLLMAFFNAKDEKNRMKFAHNLKPFYKIKLCHQPDIHLSPLEIAIQLNLFPHINTLLNIKSPTACSDRERRKIQQLLDQPSHFSALAYSDSSHIQPFIQWKLHHIHLKHCSTDYKSVSTHDAQLCFKILQYLQQQQPQSNQKINFLLEIPAVALLVKEDNMKKRVRFFVEQEQTPTYDRIDNIMR